jgi:hypothetical protein
MKRTFWAAMLLTLFWSPAAGAFFTYSQWEQLSPDARAYYIAGTFDFLVSIATTDEDERVASYYSKCINDANMTYGQLSENLKIYASERPSLQGGTVQFVLFQYLIALCGAPP